MIAETAPSVRPTPTGTRLDRLNPVTRIVIAIIVSGPLILTLDWLSAATALVAVVIAALAVGFGIAQIARRLGVLLILAAITGTSMALYGEQGGRVWFHWLLITVTDNSLTLALAVFLRVLALGLSALLLFGDLDPTELADGLAQIVRLPARFVLGALAGVRMLGLFAADWRTLALARRARGLGDTGRLRRWLSMAFALLVLAIRRGSRLATAMEARGFGAEDGPPRTWARPSRLGRADVVGIGVAVLIVVLAVAMSLGFGTFHWVGSAG
ncbi:energy-coupling factor transporter transmembrane component T family protein [Granulicoccus phenolivorans]|uniref:energy-coupling factor transporter transmembrane component T family protein n=1 Tax=Granulicoccus phenolivorans TaxID=266854 RepID=UPI0004038B92|nr:energy-coupling factor transporter transmembrane component T [Granulicoccus phenolivorans]